MLLSKKTGEHREYVLGLIPSGQSSRNRIHRMNFRDIRFGDENIKILRRGGERLPFKPGEGLPRDGGVVGVMIWSIRSGLRSVF